MYTKRKRAKFTAAAYSLLQELLLHKFCTHRFYLIYFLRFLLFFFSPFHMCVCVGIDTSTSQASRTTNIYQIVWYVLGFSSSKRDTISRNWNDWDLLTFFIYFFFFWHLKDYNGPSTNKQLYIYITLKQGKWKRKLIISGLLCGYFDEIIFNLTLNYLFNN